MFYQISLFARVFSSRLPSCPSPVWTTSVFYGFILRIWFWFFGNRFLLFLGFIYFPPFYFIARVYSLIGLLKRKHVWIIFCLLEFIHSNLQLADGLVGLECLVHNFHFSLTFEGSSLMSFIFWPFVLNLILSFLEASQVSSFSPSVLKFHSDVQWHRCFSFIVLGIQTSLF